MSMKKRKDQKKGGRFKVIIIPLISVIILILFFVFISNAFKKEAITADQILEKKEWTDQELVDTLTRVGIQNQRRNRISKKVFKHLREQLRKRPPERRQKIIDKTLDKLIDKGHQLWTAMRTETKKKVINNMLKQIKKRREMAENCSPEQKEKIRQYLNSPQSKHRREKINKVLINKFSPEERRDLAPVVKEWMKTLDAIR